MVILRQISGLARRLTFRAPQFHEKSVWSGEDGSLREISGSTLRVSTPPVNLRHKQHATDAECSEESMPRHRDSFSNTAVFTIVKANHGDPQSSREVEKIKGRVHAEKRVEELQRKLGAEEKATGWYYYLK